MGKKRVEGVGWWRRRCLTHNTSSILIPFNTNTDIPAETKEHINDKRIRPRGNQKRKLPKTEVKASAISCMPTVLVTEPQEINTKRSTLSTVATYF